MAYQWKFLADLRGTPGDVSLYGPAWAPERNVPSSQDLNTFKVPGVHRIATPDTATIVNLPAGMSQAGILENLQTGSGTAAWWAQRITQHGNSPRMWWRSTRDLVGGWNDWEEVLTNGGKITELHVFLAVGQSNMSGRGAPSGGSRDPEDPRIMQYGAIRRVLENATVPLDMHDTATGISPATTFARAYLKSQPSNVGVLIVPAAHGATGFTTAASTLTWTPGAASASQYDLPALAITQTNEAVTAAKAAGYTVSVNGILWHQGENNTTMSQATYASNLDALIAYFRTGLSNSKLPFVVGQMVPEGITANPGRENIDAAHQATPSRVAYTGFAASTTNGYNAGDTTHMSRSGVEFIGRNYVNGLQAARIGADLQPRMAAVEAKNAAQDTAITQNTVWMGVINTGGDLNTAVGKAQRTSLYEIANYGAGIANMPPNPYIGQLEVISDADGKNIIQRVTYDPASANTYAGIYYRTGADLSGTGTFTFAPWLKQLSELDLPKAADPSKELTITSAITAGHGWVAGPSTNATFNLNDTSDSAIGDRVVKITTDGTGANSYVQKTGMSLDLTGRGLVFWLKAQNMQSINSVSVSIANADTMTPAYFATLPLAAGMKSPLTEGEWYPVYLSMGNAGVNSGTPARTNVTAIRLNITDKAGQPAPVLKLGGVGTFQDKTPRYPGGVLSLTFDDTYDVQATVAAPKMAQYGFSGTSYLIYDRIGGTGYVSTDQLNMLKEVYGWEIGAHATSSAAHVDWTAQTPSWVDTELQAQKSWQAANGFATETFAYPIGPFNSTTARIVQKYYASARSTYSWTNSTARPHRYRLSCYVINAAVSLSSAKVWVDRAVAQGGWPVFLFHNLVASGATANDWLISDFNALIDYIAASGLPVATVGDVIRQRP